ncbi:DUF3150 domain-containing protein [Patescibacteria group bacterium]|nr:DUF3150 domain-containing protein [Patescibacteria group bacterium]
MSELSAERLFKDNAIVRLTFSTWSNKKEQTEDSNRRTGVWFRYVDPKVLQDINSKVRKVREYLSSSVGMHFDWGPGLYLVRRAKLIQVLEKLRDFEFEFVDEVETFVFDKYEEALEETRANKALTDEQLDTAPPADTLLSKFKMTYTTFVVGLPESTGDIAIDKRLQTEFCSALDESFVNIGERLRMELVELLQTVHAAVTDPERKKYYESMLSNIVDWCENFETRNFLADEKLQALAVDVLAMAEGVTIDELRASTEMKAALAAQTGALLKKVQELKPTRRTIIL